MEDVGLYIHVPFCSGKCHYCEFYSEVAKPEDVARYLRALRQEAGWRARMLEEASSPRIASVYVGGGTPTQLSERELHELLATVRDVFKPGDDCEVTVEANPESVTEAKLVALVGGGVRRVSLGVQSFQDVFLARLGRRHRASDAERAIGLIRRAGVPRLSLDLMYALPGQSVEQWQGDLRRAVGFGVEHLSCYELTIEHEAARARLGAPAEDVREGLAADMFYLADDYLCGCGFEHYEISNYARLGCRSAHNMRYWRNEPYLGLGPAAAGYWLGERSVNVANLDAYCRWVIDEGRLPVDFRERLEGKSLAGETAMLALRTSDGIDREEFLARTGLDPFAVYAEPIARLTEAGLLEVSRRRIALTRRGMALSNEVMAEFLADPRKAV